MPDFLNFAFPPLPVQQHGDKLMPRLPTRSIRDTLKPAKKKFSQRYFFPAFVTSK